MPLVLLVPTASASAPQKLWQSPEPAQIAPSPVGGRFASVRDIAANPSNGHVYITDSDNARLNEFTAWGKFVKAWGWDVSPEGAPGDTAENRLEVCTVACKAGVSGAGGGQFNNPTGVAVDADGDIYVFETGNLRVQKFSPSGEFLFAIGRDVVASGPDDSAVNERQQVTVAGTGGKFSLGFENAFTGAIGNGKTEAGSTVVTRFSTTSGTFAVGDGITNVLDSIPPGTEIVAVGSETLTLSQPATASNAGAQTFATDIPFDASAATVEAELNALPTISASEGSVSVSGGPGDEAGSNPYIINFEGRFLGDDPPTLTARSSVSGPASSVTTTTLNQGGGVEICKVADVCKAGVAGTDPGEFSSSSGLPDPLAFNPVTNTVFVGDTGRIQEFNLDGEFVAQIGFGAGAVRGLAADGSGDLYYTLNGKSGVWKTGPAGPVAGSPAFPGVDVPGDVAVDADGNVYVAEITQTFGGIAGFYMLGFDASGEPIPGMTHANQFAKYPFEYKGGGSPENESDIFGLGVNLCVGSDAPGNLYVTHSRPSSGILSRAYVEAYGTPPIGCEPPPVVPPDIEDQYATSVNTDGAVVRAEVNPHFWADTAYYVQYGTEPCAEGGCETQQSPSAILTKSVLDASVTTEGVFLDGLHPGTTYYYRFVVQSGGSAGEPVFGEEGSFTTFRISEPDPCPANARFRVGPGAALPDCRAYEMVSPLNKANGDVVVGAGGGGGGETVGLFRSSASGERITYSSVQAFGKTLSGPQTSQYLATRHPLGDSGEGWSTEAISPPMTSPVLGITSRLPTPYMAFSSDLCTAWLRTAFDPPLASGAITGFANLYRRQNCGAQKGDYEALSTVEPPNAPPVEYWRLAFQGASADGTHAILLAPDNLTEDAPTQGTNCLSGSVSNACEPRLYEHLVGQPGLRYVCILPNETATKQPCSAGTTGELPPTETYTANLQNAISADGERIFWTDSGNGPGRIFVRIAGVQTLDVSRAAEALSQTSASRFWGAARDGASAIFTTGGDLYEFEVDTEATTLIASDVQGLLGVSEDATRAYFVSEEAGGLNLYFWEKGADEPRFIGTLAPRDVADGTGSPSPFAAAPLKRSSRVSPDGLHVAFMSTASLTDYDNTDAISGKPDAEVFLYDATADGGAGKLRCVSCNPSGARPQGRPILVNNGLPTELWAAAKIPGCVMVRMYCGWERSLQASRALSENGSRLYFESQEALVPRDANGVQDVYQWQEAGSGSCDEGDATYSEEAGGCIDLISSGQSPRESAFVDADTTGEDVFFTTLSSLSPQDYGLVDIYDARTGGGLPAPPTLTPACEGEACQGPIAAPNDPTPASSSYEGAGNVVEERAKKAKKKARRCPKGKRRVKHKGKVRCQKVKKKHKGKRKHHRRARNHGRAAR